MLSLCHQTLLLVYLNASIVPHSVQWCCAPSRYFSRISGAPRPLGSGQSPDLLWRRWPGAREVTRLVNHFLHLILPFRIWYRRYCCLCVNATKCNQIYKCYWMCKSKCKSKPELHSGILCRQLQRNVVVLWGRSISSPWRDVRLPLDEWIRAWFPFVLLIKRAMTWWGAHYSSDVECLLDTPVSRPS
jgi:hypothetical protein